MYNVLFPDGSTERLASNIIAIKIYSSVENHGLSTSVMKQITGHKKQANAYDKADGWTTNDAGKKHQRITTQCWDLRVDWTDGNSSWVTLADLKEANPIEVADYAKANKINVEPDFSCWIPYVLKKRKDIISAVNQRIRKIRIK